MNQGIFSTDKVFLKPVWFYFCALKIAEAMMKVVEVMMKVVKVIGASEWAIYCSLMPSEQFFNYPRARTSHIAMKQVT